MILKTINVYPLQRARYNILTSFLSEINTLLFLIKQQTISVTFLIYKSLYLLLG